MNFYLISRKISKTIVARNMLRDYDYHSTTMEITEFSDDFTIIFFSIKLNPRKYTRKTR